MESTYFSAAIVIIMIFVFIWYNKKINKKINKKKIQKQKLEQAKIKEDFELSLQKEVKCEDGKIRIYSDSMLGILTDYPNHINTTEGGKISLFSVFFSAKNKIIKADQISVKQSDLEMMNFKTDKQFDLYITTLDWFSENGKKLNFEEVKNANKNWIKLNNEYSGKYSTLMKRYSRKIHSSPAGPLEKFEELVMINNYLFLKIDFRPFYGLIDNVKYVNGQKIIQ
jgi:hypothetical protein